MDLINKTRYLKKQGLTHKEIAERLGISVYKVNRISSTYVLGRASYPEWKESINSLSNIDRQGLKRMVLLGTYPLNKLAKIYNIKYRHLLTAKRNWVKEDGVRYAPYKGTGDALMQNAVGKTADFIHGISQETGVPDAVILYRVIAAGFRDNRTLMGELKELAEKACKPR